MCACLGINTASCSISSNACPNQVLSQVNLCYLLSSPLKGLYGSLIALEINSIFWVVIHL